MLIVKIASTVQKDICDTIILIFGNMLSKICSICGNEFIVDENRDYTPKYCSRKCVGISTSMRQKGKNNPSWKDPITLHCINCGKEFKLKPGELKKRAGKYCSRDCAYEYQRKFGHPNRIHTKYIYCKNCGKKVIRSQHNQIFCSHDCYAEWNIKDNHWRYSQDNKIKRTCLWCGNSFYIYVNILNNRDRHGRYCSRQCMAKYNKKYHQSNHPTNIEHRVIKISHEYNLPLKFVGDGSFWIERLNPDFIVDGQRKVIEVFGDYWHTGKMLRNDWRRTESGRKFIFNQYGYDALVIWSSEMDKSSDVELVNIITDFLNK